MELTKDQIDILKSVPEKKFNNTPGYDVFGRKLETGDYVYAVSHATYSHKLQRRICIVEKSTEKKITLLRVDDYHNFAERISVEPQNIIKIDESVIQSIIDFNK